MSEQSDNGLPTGAIIGIAIAAVLLCALAVAASVHWSKKRVYTIDTEGQAGESAQSRYATDPSNNSINMTSVSSPPKARYASELSPEAQAINKGNYESIEAITN